MNTFSNSDIVKEIDDNFVVVKVIRLATDLDEETNEKIEVLLDTIHYY